MKKTKNNIADTFKSIQSTICERLESIDGKALFASDNWLREEGGGGRTNILTNGNIIEKGGVAFSKVHGKVTELMKKQMLLEGDDFFATGISIVIHPKSPHIPIIHMNVRYFESDNTFWFGGGIDLTPHIITPLWAKEFHNSLKTICDKYNLDFYHKFKNQADDYFYIPHRNETRGVGGIFFDHENFDKELLFEFCCELALSFPEIYEKQVDFGKGLPITEDEKTWQLLRRGRYVEFNLVHDKGTKFGLFSGGRTESILMSLPPDAKWIYDFDYKSLNFANDTLSYLKKGVNF